MPWSVETNTRDRSRVAIVSSTRPEPSAICLTTCPEPPLSGSMSMTTSIAPATFDPRTRSPSVFRTCTDWLSIQSVPQPPVPPAVITMADVGRSTTIRARPSSTWLGTVSVIDPAPPAVSVMDVQPVQSTSVRRSPSMNTTRASVTAPPTRAATDRRRVGIPASST